MPVLDPSLLLQPWIQSHISMVNLPNKDIYCIREVAVAVRLIHFVPFWEEVIHADCWVLVVIHHGYSIDLFQTSPPLREQSPVGPVYHKSITSSTSCFVEQTA